MPASVENVKWICKGTISCKSTFIWKKKKTTGRDTYTTVNSAIANLLGCGRQVCEVSGYNSFGLLRHKAADGHVDIVATIESL